MRINNLDGKTNPNSKVDEEVVRRILNKRPDCFSAGPLAREIANEEGISLDAVMRIWRRQSWSHVRI